MKKRELRRQPKEKKGQKHHYIPQFYLRPWLGDDNRLEEFGRVPPSNQIRSRRRGTESTGYEYDLYTIPGVTEETKQNIERVFMGTVDKTAAAARDELLRGNIPQGELRHAWARFLMSMAMRTPEEMRRFKENFVWYWIKPVAKYQDRYDAIRKPDWPPTLEEYFVSQDPHMVQRQAIVLATDLMQQENVTRHLMGAEWWVFDSSRVQRPFMTSDHPFVMTNGLKRPDGHFAIPIGPRHLFVAFMQKDFGEWFRRMPTGKIVRATNEAVIGQGRKYVYGIDGANIAEVRRLMGKREYMTLLPTMTKKEGDEAKAHISKEIWDAWL
ncbi:DUF4238 domain-containing protein [Shinella curvata]|uniref:DUF4238 domain-containing protein n=1 Tax=Shinella curvata TaxID=1817964 RepID=A0ABT8XML6_9HYPH|nr:DUF4238 domain-containing protein [Shinella curvata]MCJ8057178.1 DUF4238 domain-containing protein [Shinella curvata]MDO6124975.1 DUF4238 domain-containing protein [Shinella curvata]